MQECASDIQCFHHSKKDIDSVTVVTELTPVLVLLNVTTWENTTLKGLILDPSCQANCVLEKYYIYLSRQETAGGMETNSLASLQDPEAGAASQASISTPLD